MKRLISLWHRLPDFVVDVWLGMIQNLPGPLGYRFRYAFWKKRLKFLGVETRIDAGVYFQNPNFISVGNNSWIDRGVVILAGRDGSARKKRWVGSQDAMVNGEVFVGDNIHIGPYSIISGIEAGVHIGNDCALSSGVKVYAFSHHYRFDDAPDNSSCSFGPMVPHDRQSMLCGFVVLKENVGVALNAVLLPGVTIGRDSFVFTNSVLFDHRFEENSLISGSPAVRRGARFKNRCKVDLK
jgi:acetyltransferase-like isoleucine patch superfamily enzyme